MNVISAFLDVFLVGIIIIAIHVYQDIILIKVFAMNVITPVKTVMDLEKVTACHALRAIM